MSGRLYTIGHSTQKEDEFFRKLKENGVTILVDVRSTPYSKFAPQFNKDYLEEAARKKGITYVHEAEAFGARQKDVSLYKKGYLDFNRVRSRPVFKRKISEYAEKIRLGDNVALMCSEKDPTACHRAIMVARGFSLYGLSADHILPDGKLVSQEVIDKKLLDKFFPGHDQPSLFGDVDNNNDDLLKAAYDMQNEKIGYKLEDLKVFEKKAEKRSQEMKQWTGVNENGELLTTKDRIAKFRGEYGFLSNMYDCPVTYNGVTYKSSESAYQAQRPVKQEDRDKFVFLSGLEAKKLVNELEGRTDWHVVNTGIMEEIVRAKFQQNPSLTKMLLATGDRQLVEGNRWHDTYWGVCNGRGENMLGKILMKVREEMKQELTKEAQEKSEKDVFVVSVTGHRPNRLFGYNWENDGNRALSARIGEQLNDVLQKAKEDGYEKFQVVTGMALGADQMVCAHAIRLAHSPEFQGKMTVEAAVPCKNQERQWPAESQKIYHTLLRACDVVTMVSDKEYTPKAMQDRNEYMVNKANIVLSVYDGVSKGGTGNCIEYAKSKGVPIHDIGLNEIFEKYPRYAEKKSLGIKTRNNTTEATHEK